MSAAVFSLTRSPCIPVVAVQRSRDEAESTIKNISMKRLSMIPNTIMSLQFSSTHIFSPITVNKKKQLQLCGVYSGDYYGVQEAPVVDGFKICRDNLFQEYVEKYERFNRLSLEEQKEKYPWLFDEDKLPWWYPKWAHHLIGGVTQPHIDADECRGFRSLALYSIDLYNNKEKTSLEFVRVVGCYCGEPTYYVVLEARNDEGENKLYCAEVSINLDDQVKLRNFLTTEQILERFRSGLSRKHSSK